MAIKEMIKMRSFVSLNPPETGPETNVTLQPRNCHNLMTVRFRNRRTPPSTQSLSGTFLHRHYQSKCAYLHVHKSRCFSDVLLTASFPFKFSNATRMHR